MMNNDTNAVVLSNNFVNSYRCNLFNLVHEINQCSTFCNRTRKRIYQGLYIKSLSKPIIFFFKKKLMALKSPQNTSILVMLSNIVIYLRWVKKKGMKKKNATREK